MAFVFGEDEKGNKLTVEVNQGQQMSVSAPLLEMSLEHVTGYRSIVIEGNKDSLDTGTEDIWGGVGDLSYLTAAETMNIASTDANDTSAGTGARTVKIKGLDSAHLEIEETVVLNGVANVLTSNSYLRVSSIEVLTAGSGQENAGDITATASTAATVQCFMATSIGISKNSQFTVPANKKFVIISAEMNATKTIAGLTPNVSIDAMARKLGVSADAPWLTLVRRKIDTEVIDQLLVLQTVGSVIDEKSDLRFRATTDQNNTEVRVRYYGVLVNK